jgi:hypothetical protein
MSRAQRDLVTELVRRIVIGELGNEVVQIRKAHEKLLCESGFSEAEAAETSESCLEKICKQLAKESQAYKESFGIELLEIENGRCRLLQRVMPETLASLNDLTPQAFELFCAAILGKLGGDSKITGGSGDKGVDFYAEKVNMGGLGDLVPDFARPTIIGQAKRYTNAVSEPEVREFVGGAALKAKELEANRGHFTPVVFAFWTSSKLDKRGIDTCKKLGVWYLNGTMLVQAAERLRINLGAFETHKE